MVRRATPELFWSHVDRHAGDAACWPWTLHSHRGYGRAGYHGRTWIAHRLAWTLTHGPIPAGLDVLHGCDNPPCCNPRHLRLGTDVENTADKIARGRHARGETTRQAVLSVAAVRAIFVAFHEHGAHIADLARRHGVTAPAVYFIVRGENWRSATLDAGLVIKRWPGKTGRDAGGRHV